MVFLFAFHYTFAPIFRTQIRAAEDQGGSQGSGLTCCLGDQSALQGVPREALPSRSRCRYRPALRAPATRDMIAASATIQRGFDNLYMLKVENGPTPLCSLINKKPEEQC